MQLTILNNIDYFKYRLILVSVNTPGCKLTLLHSICIKKQNTIIFYFYDLLKKN